MQNPLNEAQERYRQWLYRVSPEVRDAFQPIIVVLNNGRPEIMACFDHPITNAYTESLNSLIQVMNRLGRDYSFEALRARILFAEGAFKHGTRPKFERQQMTTRDFAG